MSRVLLLDLHAQRDGFLTDNGLSRLAARLEGAGVTARLVHARGVAPNDPALSASLAEPCDCAVVARAWSVELVDWLRGALPPNTPLVRLTRDGTPSALDERFDHVVTDDGLAALLEGRTPEAARFRPAVTADLRRRLVEDAAPRPAPAAGGRPSISGPASGCPWLADARKSPHFAGLEDDTIQFKGCTFCLDQVGAYAAPTEAQVLASWLEQLRALRARDPRVREVLLTDERPHPFLPALFEAVEREPALHGLELLVKSRVDWLLEFSESHLARAAQAAGRSNSVLHVYLAGFENFDAFHLELFNKGQTAEDNAAAIEVLRGLAARFPASFEYLRLRAHGIVLFTPWTTPEALLTNARWMARTGFEALRSEALKTRLRLYPRTPLYALAQRDGLLTERFDDARPDRAIEQGYDASAPWRFRDARTEAVYRVASRLASTRRFDEADVLASAAQLLITFPRLAEVPDDAHLPLFAAAELRRPGLLRGLGVLGFDLELEAVRAGHKPAALKENVAAADAAGLVRAYRAMGFAADVASTHVYDAQSGSHLPGATHAIVAVARDEATLERLLAAQRDLATKGSRRVEELGALMGYPACCTAAFAAQADRGDNLENERQTLLRTGAEPVHPLLHRLGVLRLVSHHLCTASCEPSLRLARQQLDAVRARSAEAAERVERALGGAVLALDHRRLVDLEGDFDGERFVVRSVGEEARAVLGFATAGLAHLQVEPGGVRFTFADGSQRFERAPRPVLVTPGRPLAESARRAIASPERPSPSRAQRGVPPLPGVVRVGVAVGGYRLAQVERAAEAWRLVLRSASDELVVTLTERRPDVDGPAAGRFAFDFGPRESLTEARAAALTLLARVLADVQKA